MTVYSTAVLYDFQAVHTPHPMPARSPVRGVCALGEMTQLPFVFPSVSGTPSLLKASKEKLEGHHGHMAMRLGLRGPLPKSNLNDNDQYFCF